MLEDTSLRFLVESRAIAAIVYGVAVAALLWLTGLSRFRGALAAGGLLALAVVPASWPGAHLLAVSVGAAGIAARAADRPAGRVAPLPGLRQVMVLGMPFVVCLWVAAVADLAGLWLAAGLGALAAATGLQVAATSTGPESAPRYRLPSPRPVEEGGLSGRGLGWGATVAAGIGAAALALELVGPGEPGPAILGALVGIGLAGDGSLPRRLGCILVGAALAASLTAFLV